MQLHTSINLRASPPDYNSGLLTSAKDVRRAVVAGDLPTGLAANNPDSDPIVALEDSSISTDTYGSVNPYVADIDPDDPQPYGVYPVTIQFEVCSAGGNSGTLSEARNHTIVVYDDFNLDGILGDVMDRNRQRSDYAEDADTEWAAYQTAVSNGFALLQGDPNHSHMFDDTDTVLEGTQNEYYVRAEAVKAAVAALDAKAVTDTAKLTALETVVNTYRDVDSDDYVLFTYDRFEDAYDRAAGLVNSQVAPEDATDFVAPALAEFDLVYAKAQLELWGGRLIKKAPVKTYLAEALEDANALVETNYTTESWAAFKTARDAANAVNNDTSATLLQTTVNDARIELLKKQYDLVERPFIVLKDNSTAVIDTRNKFIYGITPSASININDYVQVYSSADTLAITNYNDASTIGTGAVVQVKPIDSQEVLDEYTVIVFGDLDSDGEVTFYDYLVVDEYLYGTSNVISTNAAFFAAADVDRNGVITTADADAISAGTVNQTNPVA